MDNLFITSTSALTTIALFATTASISEWKAENYAYERSAIESPIVPTILTTSVLNNEQAYSFNDEFGKKLTQKQAIELALNSLRHLEDSWNSFLEQDAIENEKEA